MVVRSRRPVNVLKTRAGNVWKSAAVRPLLLSEEMLEDDRVGAECLGEGAYRFLQSAVRRIGARREGFPVLVRFGHRLFLWLTISAGTVSSRDGYAAARLQASYRSLSPAATTVNTRTASRRSFVGAVGEDRLGVFRNKRADVLPRADVGDRKTSRIASGFIQTRVKMPQVRKLLADMKAPS